MAPTEAQQAWVETVLFGGARNRDHDSSDLVALKAESQAVRSSTRVSDEEFEKIRKLFMRLCTMVDAAADNESLSKLSELNTGGGGSPGGQVQRVADADFDFLGGLFQKAFASATAAAPSDSLSQLAQLGAGTPEGSSEQPRATRTQFADIEQGLKEARWASTIKLDDLLALADLRREA